jgi:hypothetical protein
MQTMSKAPSICLAVALLGIGAAARATEGPSVLVFSEPGFPAADSAPPTEAQLAKLLPEAERVRAGQLASRLARLTTRLLVLPYGSAFPEASWPDIQRFLRRGGNLLAIGGRPFTRAAVRTQAGWHLRPASVRFTRPLMIDQYQDTPGSEGLAFLPNPDQPVTLPRFDWSRAFGLVIRLSAVDLYQRGGSAGSLDARLDTLAWGVRDGVKLAAPVVQIDHLKHGFDGGRWIFVSAELPQSFWASEAAGMIRGLATRACAGSESFTARPSLPLYAAGEKVQIEVRWQTHGQPAGQTRVKLTVFPEAQTSRQTVLHARLPVTQPLVLPAPRAAGLFLIEAELLEGETLRARYRSGFWMRDRAWLRSSPRLTVGRDYFEVDGQPLAVLGTTHMSSEVQRLFFAQPNVAVWDRDLAQIRAAGLNMIRTGFWTAWDRACNDKGVPNEPALRALEAYLMTARKHGLPVQFNFFAFVPDVLGGQNPYLDAEAVRRQQTLVTQVVARFHDVPFLAWDLINEPSFSTQLWKMRPNGDAVELAKWNAWIARRYPDRAGLAALWNLPVDAVSGTVPLPEDLDFSPRGVYVGHNSLKVYDYVLFAQEQFAGWARGLRDALRATGSRQLVTVGQDEGGIQDRPSPAFWARAVDFTTNHSWWQNDAVLWDSLAAKQPGQPMLIQETGLQRELRPDETARRTLASEAALLERKLALAFVRGAGAIQWLWHSNAYMTESNETPIGAVRADGTEKPEASVLRRFAAFAASLSPSLKNPAPPRVAVVTSQATQFSVLADLQLEAQRKAVRALAYHARVVPAVVAENRLPEMGEVALAILPSPQALGEEGWRTLLAYVDRGGSLLVSGPVERDEHWQVRARAAEVGLAAEAQPLTYHSSLLRLSRDIAIPLAFDQQKQSALDTLAFPDGATLKEIRRGKGRIFWAADPVELAEGTAPAAALYRHVLGKVGVKERFELLSDVPAGVLVCPVPLERDVLYVLVSEEARSAKIELRDKPTGVRLELVLQSERAALALIDGGQRKLTARYGF